MAYAAKFNNDNQLVLSGFKAARYFSLINICELKPSATDIEFLCVLPFFNDSEVIEGLKSELANYSSVVEKVFIAARFYT